MKVSNQEEKEIPFEESFTRLEEILEKMHSGALSLDESIKLYEEADKLIVYCNKRLSDAERKIEVLIKNRNGDLVIGQDQKPSMQNFTPTNGNRS